MRLHGFTTEREPGAAWLGYGAEARVVFRDSDGGGLFLLVGRAGAGAGPAGLELEPVVGLGVGSDVFAIGGLAVLYSFPWFGVGVGTQFPIAAERPPWLEKVQLAFRLQFALEPCRSRFFSCRQEEQE